MEGKEARKMSNFDLGLKTISKQDDCHSDAVINVGLMAAIISIVDILVNRKLIDSPHVIIRAVLDLSSDELLETILDVSNALSDFVISDKFKISGSEKSGGNF